ncbi:MAG: LCP family protein [Syntrophomonadaceae bacterium]
MSFFQSRKGFVTAAITIFLVMMGIGALLGGKLNTLFFSSVQTKALTGKPINILFMGIDARDTKSNSRSDTMILASIDPGTDKVVMVSIPRDTRIKNSAGKYDKINSINMVDGPEAACDKVGELLNVPVDYYVITNFAGFGDIVDALGGVHINIESNMYHYDDEYPELTINLKKGYQYLNGQQALAFVRYRGGPTADIGRTENQQKFIKALAAEMMQSKTILRLPQLIPELNKNVRTNLPLKDMIYLANMANKLDLANLSAQTLPGYFYHDSSTGASYWEADQQIAGILVESLLQGQTFKVVNETPANMKTTGTVKTPSTTSTTPSTSTEVQTDGSDKNDAGTSGDTATKDQDTDSADPDKTGDSKTDDSKSSDSGSKTSTTSKTTTTKVTD